MSVRKLNPQDPKSPWVCEYTDPMGKRRRETPASGLKKDAQEVDRRIKNDLAGGRHISRSRALTVADVCDRFLENCERKVDDKRIHKGRLVNLRIAIRRTIKPAIGHILFIDLRPIDIEAMYNEAVASKALSPATARQRVGELKGIQDFAIKRDFAKDRVVDDALAELRGIKADAIRRFTLEQGRLILSEAGRRQHRCNIRATATGNIMVHFAAICGMRFGEIIGLRLEDLDYEGGRIRIRKSMSRYDGHKGPKTKAGVRDFPLPPSVAHLIQSWTVSFHIPNELGLLITTRSGKRMTATHYHEEFWRPLLDRLGLGEPDKDGKRLHFHALRHLATSMLSKHVPLADLPGLMGHKTLDVTLQVYMHEITADHARASAVRDMAAEMQGLSLLPDATKMRLPVEHIP